MDKERNVSEEGAIPQRLVKTPTKYEGSHGSRSKRPVSFTQRRSGRGDCCDVLFRSGSAPERGDREAHEVAPSAGPKRERVSLPWLQGGGVAAVLLVRGDPDNAADGASRRAICAARDASHPLITRRPR